MDANKTELMDTESNGGMLNSTIRLVVRAKNHRLLTIREKMGLTQAEIADLLGVSMGTYGQLERLDYSQIASTTLLKVAEILEENVDELFPNWATIVGEVYNSKDNYYLLDDEYAKTKLLSSGFGGSPKLLSESFYADLEVAMSDFTDREKFILKSYFGLGGYEQLTLEEIGDKLNLTRARIREIKEKSLRKLRHSTRNKLLRGYLENNFQEIEEINGNNTN